MKVLACGDREWTDEALVDRVLSAYSDGTVLVVGGARGADTIAERVGRRRGFAVVVFPADWATHGRRAGPLRNRQMLNEKPDIVIAFHDDLPNSKGTKDAVAEARRRGIPVKVIRHEDAPGALDVFL